MTHMIVVMSKYDIIRKWQIKFENKNEIFWERTYKCTENKLLKCEKENYI